MKIEILKLICQVYDTYKLINPDQENVSVHFEKDNMEIEFSFEDEEPEVVFYKRNWIDSVYTNLKKDVFTKKEELSIRNYHVDNCYSPVYVPNTIICDIEQAISKITKEEVLAMLDYVEGEYIEKRIAATNEFFDIALGTNDVKKTGVSND